jgi:DHA1 family tetracycline resistance protein-like MFS transporter
VLGAIDVRAPFWAAAGLSSLNGLMAVSILKESLPREHRTPLNWRRVHPAGAVASLWRDYPALVPWHLACLAFGLAVAGVNAIFPLYVSARFAWGSSEIGLYGATIAVVNIIGQSFLISRAIAFLRESGALLTGLSLQVAGSAIAAFAPSGWVFTLGVTVMMLGGIAGPVQTGLMNRIISANDRGRLAGVSGSLASVAGLTAPMLFVGAFAPGVHGAVAGPLSAAPMVLGFVLMALSAVITLIAVRRWGGGSPGAHDHGAESQAATAVSAETAG